MAKSNDTPGIVDTGGMYSNEAGQGKETTAPAGKADVAATETSGHVAERMGFEDNKGSGVLE
jgi:hypothetical protein